MLPQEMKETFEVILANRNFLYTLFYKTFGRETDAAYLSVLGSDAVSDAFTLLSQESEDTMSKAAAFAAAQLERGFRTRDFYKSLQLPEIPAGN